MIFPHFCNFLIVTSECPKVHFVTHVEVHMMNGLAHHYHLGESTVISSTVGLQNIAIRQIYFEKISNSETETRDTFK